MQIDVQIAYNGKEIDAEAILDSGAEGVYCNTSFIKKYSLPTYDIELPVYPRCYNPPQFSLPFLTLPPSPILPPTIIVNQLPLSALPTPTPPIPWD